MIRFLKFAVYFLLLLVACNQNKKSSIKVGNTVLFSVENNLANNPAFTNLNKQKEIRDLLDMDTSKRRTSVVNYCIQYRDRAAKTCSNENNCKAFFFNSDTLEISIGIGGLFGRRGFSISYKDGKFQIRPFYMVDAGPPYDLKEA